MGLAFCKGCKHDVATNCYNPYCESCCFGSKFERAQVYITTGGRSGGKTMFEKLIYSPIDGNGFIKPFVMEPSRKPLPKIKKVIHSNPCTIVIWDDDTKTIVRCQSGELYDEEKGLAMAISKKALGNKGNYFDEFKKWLPEKKEVPENSLEAAEKALSDGIKKAVKEVGRLKKSITTK